MAEEPKNVPSPANPGGPLTMLITCPVCGRELTANRLHQSFIGACPSCKTSVSVPLSALDPRD